MRRERGLRKQGRVRIQKCHGAALGVRLFCFAREGGLFGLGLGRGIRHPCGKGDVRSATESDVIPPTLLKLAWIRRGLGSVGDVAVCCV
jgi:hypothetical protein